MCGRKLPFSNWLLCKYQLNKRYIENFICKTHWQEPQVFLDKAVWPLPNLPDFHVLFRSDEIKQNTVSKITLPQIISGSSNGLLHLHLYYRLNTYHMVCGSQNTIHKTCTANTESLFAHSMAMHPNSAAVSFWKGLDTMKWPEHAWLLSTYLQQGTTILPSLIFGLNSDIAFSYGTYP